MRTRKENWVKAQRKSMPGVTFLSTQAMRENFT